MVRFVLRLRHPTCFEDLSTLPVEVVLSHLFQMNQYTTLISFMCVNKHYRGVCRQFLQSNGLEKRLKLAMLETHIKFITRELFELVSDMYPMSHVLLIKRTIRGISVGNWGRRGAYEPYVGLLGSALDQIILQHQWVFERIVHYYGIKRFFIHLNASRGVITIRKDIGKPHENTIHQFKWS
jgi:hypothetical protein